MRPTRLARPLLALWCLFSLSANAANAATAARTPIIKRPKLTLLLVIDQFRADYLLRFESRFLPPRGKGGDVGGFAYLMTEGAYFPMAEYGISQSMTCPGHATMLTGAYPYQMGIPINGWMDTQKGEYRYCAEDESFPIVGGPHRAHTGTAPTLLRGTTVGDELKNSGIPSRVVTVALKDRAAIMMGGHRADLAIWMHHSERKWVSSKYYLKDGILPEWMNSLNREIALKPGQKIRWELTGKGTGYSDPAYSPMRDFSGTGIAFPHEALAADRAALAMPYGLELTEQAAEHAFDAYRLGQGGGPDLMAISFSSHDYMGHAFGPNSREMEEMTIREDLLIARFLNHVRKKIPGGLANVVIALTADHGTPPDPRLAKKNGFDAGTIVEATFTEELEKTLNERFGKPSKSAKWTLLNHDLNVFVNRGTVKDRGAEMTEVLATIKEKILTMPGIAYAFTSYDYEARRLPPALLGEQAMHTYIPGRSGDVVALAKPYWMNDDSDTVTHLTGYTYDRMVPLIFAGQGIRRGIHPAHVRMIDLAPTLAYLLGVLPPANSEGRVLTEALSVGGSMR